MNTMNGNSKKLNYASQTNKEHSSYVHVNLLHDKPTPNSPFKSDLLMLLVYFVGIEENSIGVKCNGEKAKYIKI